MMKRYIIIANVLLITVGAYLGTKTFFTITAPTVQTPSPPPKKTIKKPAAVAGPPARPMTAYQPIIARNLFNTVTDAENRQKKIDIDALKQTDLKLKLWGTITGDTGISYAVIEDEKKREQNLYRKDDTIQTAVLKLILREKVVLNVNGKDEVLELEKAQGITQPGHTGGSPVKLPQPIQRMQVTRQLRTQEIKLNRTRIENATQDLTQLMTQAKLRPYIEGGKQSGLLLTSIKPNSLFRQMGLRNGDIILGAGDESIDSAEGVMKLYENLKSSGGLTLQLKRRGRKKTIDYKIE